MKRRLQRKDTRRTQQQFQKMEVCDALRTKQFVDQLKGDVVTLRTMKGMTHMRIELSIPQACLLSRHNDFKPQTVVRDNKKNLGSWSVTMKTTRQSYFLMGTIVTYTAWTGMCVCQTNKQNNENHITRASVLARPTTKSFMPRPNFHV